MKALDRLFAMVATIALPAQGASAGFVCKADPKAYLAIGGNGFLYTAIDNGSGNAIVAICSVSGADGSATAQACTAWYSMLLTLRNTSGKALPHFDPAEPSNAGASGCPSFGSWQHHVPYFFLAE